MDLRFLLSRAGCSENGTKQNNQRPTLPTHVSFRNPLLSLSPHLHTSIPPSFRLHFHAALTIQGAVESCQLGPCNGAVIAHKQFMQLAPAETELDTDQSERGANLTEAVDYCAVTCLLYTSPSPRDAHRSRMPSSA